MPALINADTTHISSILGRNEWNFVVLFCFVFPGEDSNVVKACIGYLPQMTYVLSFRREKTRAPPDFWIQESVCPT
jgi:hypothetical protein